MAEDINNAPAEAEAENNDGALGQNPDAQKEGQSQPASPPENEDTLSNSGKEPGLTDVPDFPVTPKHEYDVSAKFMTSDGKVDAKKLSDFEKELKEKDENYEKRILQLRRKVSDNKAAQTKEDYFKDFAPEEKYMKYFSPETPEETRKVFDEITGELSDVYFDAGLSTKQADDVSNAMLQTMEKLGVLDLRTDEQKWIAQKEWIEEQKKILGPNAENVIRETKNFINNAQAFSAKTKNQLIDMMNTLGADFIDAMQQVKDAYGGATGGIPINAAAVGGLPSDSELKTEYLDPNTPDRRREEIMLLRSRAGRTGRLMDAP